MRCDENRREKRREPCLETFVQVCMKLRRLTFLLDTERHVLWFITGLLSCYFVLWYCLGLIKAEGHLILSCEDKPPHLTLLKLLRNISVLPALTNGAPVSRHDPVTGGP